MSYYFSKTLHTSFDRATAKAIESLQQSIRDKLRKLELCQGGAENMSNSY